MHKGSCGSLCRVSEGGKVARMAGHHCVRHSTAPWLGLGHWPSSQMLMSTAATNRHTPLHLPAQTCWHMKAHVLFEQSTMCNRPQALAYNHCCMVQPWQVTHTLCPLITHGTCAYTWYIESTWACVSASLDGVDTSRDSTILGGATEECTAHECTALHLTVQCGHLAGVKMLLEEWYSPNPTQYTASTWQAKVVRARWLMIHWRSGLGYPQWYTKCRLFCTVALSMSPETEN